MALGRMFAARPARGLSLRARLLLLAGSLGLAAAALGVAAVWDAYASARDLLEAHLPGVGAPGSGGPAVVVGAAKAGLDAARQDALLRTGIAGLLLALGGLGLAALLARRVSRALDGLAPGQDHRAGGGDGGGLLEFGRLAARLAAGSARRDRAEAALRERGEWLEAAQGAAQVGTWDWDLQANAMRWSAEQFRLHGMDGGAAAGEGTVAPARWRARISSEDLPALDTAKAEALSTGGFEAEYRVVPTGDGSVRWLAARAVLERDAQGRPRRLLGACMDVTRRRAREERHEQQLRMKDLVVAEVHHRVKNSLQLMHGVLLMQARGAGPEAAASLREAAGRVLTVAAVHRRLYEEDAQEGTDLAAYLAGLIRDLDGSLGGGRAAGAAEPAILLRAEPGLRLNARHLAPLGLVATELVTNALKHGAPPVVVSCGRHGEGVRLVVEDAGPGFPPDLDPARARGLGMRLSVALARHHQGRLEIDRSAPGGRVVLTLFAAPGSGPLFQ